MDMNVADEVSRINSDVTYNVLIALRYPELLSDSHQLKLLITLLFPAIIYIVRGRSLDHTL